MVFAMSRQRNEAFTMSSLSTASQEVFNNYLNESAEVYQYAYNFFSSEKPNLIKESEALAEQLFNLDDLSKSELFKQTILYTKMNCPEFYEEYASIFDNFLDKQKIDKRLKK